MKSVCVESAELASYSCQQSSVRFGELEEFSGLACRDIPAAPSEKQAVDLHPVLPAQSGHWDLLRAFYCAASLLPPRAEQLQFNRMASGAGSVKTELLQLGRKDKK